jgi:hypothetical protein
MSVQPGTTPTLGEVEQAQAALAAVGDGIVIVGNEQFMRDGGGRLVPLAVVKEQHKLEDQTVRNIIGFATGLSAQIARFRGHTFDDVTSFVELLAEKYDGKRGGTKGNVTLTSYDGLLKVQVQVQDLFTFGPELQIAKGLVDACITSWAEGIRPEIRALVEHAFQVDKEGRINRAALFALRRLDIEDDGWRAAMKAIGDAIRIIGSKEYVRFYKRANNRAPWQPITVDLAKAVS